MMLANTPQPRSSEEPTYKRSVFEAILAGMGLDDLCRAEYVCGDDGARVNAVDTAGLLAWHPCCEIMTTGSPDPLVEPWLRFPFTARQLAALMTDGWGSFIQEKYGDWASGPDEEQLLSIGPHGGKAKEALHAAYAAYRHAVEMAPRLDRRLEAVAIEHAQHFGQAREAAMAREALREHRHSDTEHSTRLARVDEAVADLGQAMRESRETADRAYSSWRRAVVQHLLLPIEEVSAECFECSLLWDVEPARRAELLHKSQTLRAHWDSDDSDAHWDLICEQQRVEKELRRWQLMQPKSVTEAVLHDAKLKELTAELTAISDRMHSLEGALQSAPPQIAGSAKTHIDVARLATRDQLMTAFGGFGLKQSWFNDLNSRQWLRAARKVVGQGQRGRHLQPLFCPFETMTGLIKKSRKSRLSTDAAWRILEKNFPEAYAAVSVGDPREPSG